MVDLLGYARTSPAEPQPLGQRLALEAAGCSRLWVDSDKPDRGGQPRLKELLATLRPGDEVVVSRLDRLARSLPQLVAVVDDIAAAGASLRSVSEDVTTAGDRGADARRIFAHLRDFQLSVGRDKTLAGLAAARGRGAVGGRPTVISPALVERARTLLSQPGSTVASVARDLKISRTTLYRHQLHRGQG